ncbi:MAG: NAD(P)/FAD-dependent oxidoreductase [Actinobacteria bacterium]|nr:NAD(P)/FAD-dependent oxidoreductase [Actinomycetota bacterium]
MSADVIVIGGGAAGLSCALVLGRARRDVVVVDRGAPSNLVSTGIGGLLGNDRYPPRAFYDVCRQQLAQYPSVRVVAATVAALHARPDGCTVVLDDGTRLDARHVVLATGMRYAWPAIEGIESFWGSSVFHCPFCHGWEHRDAITVAIVRDAASLERALLVTNWTSDITAVVAPGTLGTDELGLLASAGIHVEPGTVRALHGHDRVLTGVELGDGTRLRAEALLVPAPHVTRDDLIERAGLDLTDDGHVAVDAFGRTGHDRVWAVGDVSDPASTVARAIAAGSTAAIAIVRTLTRDRLTSHDAI